MSTIFAYTKQIPIEIILYDNNLMYVVSTTNTFKIIV